MAQLVRPQEHDPSHEQYPRGEEHGEDQEKKSVLKKVKAKAKKIKDTLKLHGHGHDERGTPDDHDMDEEDDEVDDDPEVLGSPGCGGAAIGSFVQGQEERPVGDPRKIGSEHERPFGMDVGGATAMEEMPSAPANTPASLPQQRGGTTNPVGDLVRGQEANRGKPELGDMIPAGLKEDPHAPKDRSEYRTPSNYEAKVTDPTGAGGEVGNSPIVASFGKMTIENEPEQEPKEKSSTEPSSVFLTGSHDQHSRDQQDMPKTDSGTSDVSGSVSPGSYTGKISSATAAIADRAISAKNLISSKLGMGGKQEPGSPKMQEAENPNMSGSASPGSFTGNISSATGVITDKAISAKNVIASKLGMGEKPEPGNPEMQEVQSPGASSDKGATVKGYFVEKLKPGEEDKALSEVISETLFKKKAEEEEEEEEESKPMGKVTESEEVKRHLGSSMEEDQGTRVDTSESSVRIPGVNVVDKLKGAVGSWFGSSTGSDQVLSSASATGGEATGQKRLQESGN